MLTAVGGNVEMAMLTLDEPHPATLSLHNALDAVQAGALLCRQLLAYAGKGRIEIATVCLADSARDVAAMFRASLPPGIALELELDDPDGCVELARGQLEQIVLNLVVNAADAMAERTGTIALKVAQRVLSPGSVQAAVGRVSHPGTYMVIECRDEGCGIRDDITERIFEPFFSTKDAGRGLGLAAVSGVVKARDGLIHIASEVDVGTTISVYLPRSSRSVSTDRGQAGTTSTHGCVLVVDDDERVRTVGARLLESAGYQTLKAASGAEALKIFEEQRSQIDVALLDVSMPGMRGPEVLERIRELDRTFPVILCSGWEPEALDLRLDPYTAFVAKPYALGSLTSTITGLRKQV